MNVIQARDVFCLYPAPAGSVAALRGLSLAVEAGERLVIHGPNGSGKTTLLRVLAGEQPVSAGSVRVAGIDLAGAGTPAAVRLRRDQLGLVDQHSRRSLRPELSVLDNVGLQLRIGGARRSAARARSSELLRTLGLAHLAGRDPMTLSGGERQRVALVAALAHQPALVLADEPTGELDAVAADQVYDLLARSVTELGTTLVVVTHDPRAARIADRVVRIRDGRLSEQWHPGRPHDEALVVDERGWLRLPEAARQVTGAVARVRTTTDGVQLVPADNGPARPATAAPGAGVTGGSVAGPVSGLGSVSDDGAVAGPAETVASLTDVTVRLGDRTILDRVSLAVRTGQVTVVSGRSGSGKSTLLGAVTGLVRTDSGTAWLNGADLNGLDRAGRAGARRDGVAVALQDGALVDAMDIDENLALARAARALPHDPALADLLLARLDLTALRTRPVRLLSGGERQRVAVARTLVVAPTLAVLDEPTSQLDETHAGQVAQALQTAGRDGLAVLVASHDPALLAVADVVVDLGAAEPDGAAPGAPEPKSAGVAARANGSVPAPVPGRA